MNISGISSDCPRLKALLASNTRLYEEICSAAFEGWLAYHAERLLERAAATGVRGVTKLAANADNAGKFENLLAELEMAVLFAQRGLGAELLRDAAFGDRFYAPDLRLTFPDGFEALVEVTHFSNGAPDRRVSEGLRRAVVAERAPYCVEYMLSTRLSTPQAWGKERAIDDKLCALVVAEVMRALRGAAGSGLSSGLVHVYESDGRVGHRMGAGDLYGPDYPEGVSLQETEQWLGTFGFERSEGPVGYAGGGATDARIVNRGLFAEKLVRDLRSKAAKRSRLPADLSTVPFIVAVLNEQVDLCDLSVLSALTGSRVAGLAHHPIEHPPAVQAAYEAGWQRVLDEWDYGPNAKLRFSDHGAYLDTADPWARELSGVLVAHGSWRLQWLPNPFARPEINDVKLLELPLALDKLGAYRSWP